jgi:hypothetical protein
MNKFFFILLVVFFSFHQDNFAQKKFVAHTLNIIEGLTSEAWTSEAIFYISKKTVNFVNPLIEKKRTFTALNNETFGYGKITNAVDNYGKKCDLFMNADYVNLHYSYERKHLMFKGTFYYD